MKHPTPWRVQYSQDLAIAVVDADDVRVCLLPIGGEEQGNQIVSAVNGAGAMRCAIHYGLEPKNADAGRYLEEASAALKGTT